MSNGVNVSVKGKLKNVMVDYKIASITGTTYVKISGDLSMTDTIKVSSDALGSGSCELFGVSIPGIGGLTINAEAKAEGKLSATLNQHIVLGISYSKADGIRAIRSFSENGGSNSTTEAQASIGVSLKCGITQLKVLKAYVHAETGLTAQYKDTLYTDGRTPSNCKTFMAYLYASYGAEASCVFTEKSYKESVVIYDMNNSPIRVYRHYEDGSEVGKCTWGETWEYLTRYNSRYGSTGWSNGFGAYGYDAAGEPYQIYEYSLSENDKAEQVATITKYYGNAVNVVIPETLDGYEVVGIGADAFSGNTYMRILTIPDGVTVIARGAFLACSNLSEVTLSKNLEEIGGYAFGDCDSLVSIEIPKSLIKTTSEYYGDYKYGYHYGVFIAADNLKNVSFEEGITKIPAGLFANNGSIEYVEIPNTVVTIEDSSFVTCSSLKTVKLSSSLTSIGVNAFAYCGNLMEVNIPDSVTQIGEGAFLACSSLSNVTLSKGIEKIGGYAFGDCDSLESIVIPKSLKETTTAYYGDYIYGYHYGVFIASDNLKNVSFEEGVTKIPAGLFGNNSSIENIEIPDSVLTIENSAFVSCSGLKTIKLSKSMTSIGADAFAYCKNLCEIAMPDSVSTIGEGAFLACSNLAEVTLSKSLEKIGGYAFGDCDSLESIVIPKSLKETTKAYYGDYIYNYQWGVFVASDNLKNINIEEGMTKIPAGLFANNDSIEEIKLPDTITSIGNDAFYKCSALKTIDCSKVESMESGAFNSCASLETITLSNDQERIAEYGFYACTSLKEIVLPESLQSIADNAFSSCSALSEITLNEGITTIGNYAFSNCSALESITLPDSLQSFGNNCFQNCAKLATIKLGAGVKAIPDYAFYEDPALTKIILPQQVTSIGANAFANCTGLTEITINRNVTSIGDNAFSYPDAMTIYGVADTYAQTYANDNGITFVELNKPATDLKLSTTSCKVGRGKTLQLTAAITPEDSSDELTWTSSDESIVTVDSTGLIKGVAEGTASIVVMIGDVIKTCEVTVYEQVTSVSLNKSAIDMSLEETFQLTATVRPSNATDQTITWKSSDESVATVDENGLVTAKAFGTAVITVTTKDQSKTATCTVTVKPIAVTGVSLSDKNVSLKAGMTYQLTASIAPENAANQEVTWSSSNTDVATVENGLITAIADGTAIIIVKTLDGNKTATCTVAVSEDVVVTTPEPTVTPTPEPTSTPTVTPTPSQTPSTGDDEDNPSATQSPTSTPESTDTPTVTPTPTPTQTPVPTQTPSAGNGGSGNVVPTVAPTAIPTSVPSVSVSPEGTGKPGENSGDVSSSDISSNNSQAEVSQTTLLGKVKLSSAKNKKKAKAILKWKKLSGAIGYQVQYSTNKKFKKAKAKTTTKTKYTLKKLKKKKTYYIRVRGYKVENGVKVYGKWSNIKKVKVKK